MNTNRNLIIAGALIAMCFSHAAFSTDDKNPLNAPGYTLVKGNYSEGVPDSLIGERNLYVDYAARNDDGTVNAVIEIPAGTNDKWETDIETGHLFWELKNGAPRVVDYLGYPANYGMIPRTLGGDGDPLDVIVMGGMLQRGTVTPVKVIGVFHLVDAGEVDDKILAVLPGTFMDPVNTFIDFEDQYPGITTIIEKWFTNYKGIDGGLESKGFSDEIKAMDVIDSALVDTNVTAVAATVAHPCDDSLTAAGYTRTFGDYGNPNGVPGSCDSLYNDTNMYWAFPPVAGEGLVNAFIEIPAGTNSKWETGHENGRLFWENKGGNPRVVKLLGYPLSYGMIPQTAYYDYDPLDIVVLGATLLRGTVTPVKLIGVVSLVDQWIVDDKLVAVVPGSPMGNAGSVAELKAYYPGVSEILAAWFSNYKGIGGGTTSKGLIDSNPWTVLDTGMTLFGQFYPEGVTAPKRNRSFSRLQVKCMPGNRAAVGFTLDRKQQVDIELHSVAGRRVVSLNSGVLDAGSHAITVDMHLCPPGCYLLKLRMGTAAVVRPVALF
ncbi:MAG: inorganic diphosphatase [Chitinispirillaceae bacterium]|nr:inorganic diphosphatase [Chitinispirillaceae bacterium]